MGHHRSMTLTQNAPLLESARVDPPSVDLPRSDTAAHDSSHDDSCDVHSGPSSTAVHAETAVLDSHLPLTAQAALDARVRQLVPTAVTRQVWLILLDSDDIQMPVMLPLGGLPQLAPSGRAEGVAELLLSLHAEFQAATFVFLVERPGPATLVRADVDALRSLLIAGRDAPFQVRCAYLCHDDGVAAYDLAELDERAFDRADAVLVP